MVMPPAAYADRVRPTVYPASIRIAGCRHAYGRFAGESFYSSIFKRIFVYLLIDLYGSGQAALMSIYTIIYLMLNLINLCDRVILSNSLSHRRDQAIAKTLLRMIRTSSAWPRAPILA